MRNLNSIYTFLSGTLNKDNFGKMSGRRAVIIPGNGAGDVAQSNWYGWANRKLNEIDGFTSTLRNMPDPMTARYKISNSYDLYVF